MAAQSTFRVRLGDDGRVVIPVQCRRRLSLEPGDTLVVDADDHGIHLRSRRQVIHDIQSEFAAFRKPGISIVDELLSDRRVEAKKEDADTAAWLAKQPND